MGLGETVEDAFECFLFFDVFLAMLRGLGYRFGVIGELSNSHYYAQTDTFLNILVLFDKVK